MIEVEGIVQGVGLRPYVHGLATARDLHGFVRNETQGLLITVQGMPRALDDFVSALTASPPPLAVIDRIRTTVADVAPLDGFSIVGPSLRNEGCPTRTFVSPDAATCADCLRELFDPLDRRYRYPFINCTHCGPRLTIVRDLPYDRSNTTMDSFVMCAQCRSEYEDPSNRRFHAQPIACAECGPTLTLRYAGAMAKVGSADPLIDAIGVLLRGGIVAIKGLGGYHISCDATSERAVATLRARKRREERPFALMVRDAEAASALCQLSPAEVALLESRERPIVLLGRAAIADAPMRAALAEVAPRSARLGVMLPYTPLHHLLMEAAGRPLVMTSGNLSDEPIAFDDADAIERLDPMIDAMLAHDRPIATRCDDSVMFVPRDRPAFVRRSRGFAPRPIASDVRFPSHILAVGGHLKNTFCLARDTSAFLSHHIGDLDNPLSFGSLADGIRHYSALVGVEAEVVAHDLHPGYMSTRLAEDLGIERRVAVQHHHAHAASCMAENGLTGPVIAVVFDGAGLGADGAVWGGEFLLIEAAGCRRMGHLGYVPLPGGDAAARQPVRMAISHIWSALGPDAGEFDLDVLNRVEKEELRVLRQMIEKNINSPPTSSVGRLFDAVAAMLGVRDVARFEGQAAMELEAIADRHCARFYEVEISTENSLLILDPGSMIRAVVGDMRAGVNPARISSAFHNGLARMILDAAERIRANTGVNRVALSGGVFQNATLINGSVAALEGAGFQVFTQRLVPCNDGGLSLGQAYVVALHDGEA